MSRARIASQLDGTFNELLRARLPGVEVLDLPRGVPSTLPTDIQVLLAAPHADWRNAAEPPPGWPFGLGFVQLVSSGLDFFPPWLFDGLPVASARGATASSIAEFALAAIYEETGVGDEMVARLEGKSSLGRLGIIIHATAGYLDPGNKLKMTLELSNVGALPVKLYYRMPIGQVSFSPLSSKCLKPYGRSELGSKYYGAQEPQASQMWRNFEDEKKTA